MSKLIQQIKDRQDAASKYLSTKRQLWDDCEDLFHNRLQDYVSSTTKSQVFDSKLTTLTLERSYRVMAQLPTGKVRGISKNDAGAAVLMNLELDKYILPNATSQFDFLTKLRMIDTYSNVYGNFFALVDWDVRTDGYVGPDMWLLNIRDVFPQVGAVSLDDSDFVIVRTWKPLSFFENIDAKDKGYKNIAKIVEQLQKSSGSKQRRNPDDRTRREDNQYPEQVAAKDSGFFEVWTQYEKDRWVDYCVDAEMEFRDIENPHDNGELPVVCKYAIPLLDDFMGMSNFERGKSMQMVVNSVWNLYLDAVKMSIFPPVLVNKDFIASPASIKWGAAEKWLVRGQVENAAKTIDLNPKGIATFNNTYQIASAAILNMFGTTDTTVTEETQAGFGRTPQALRMQERREGAGDNADRFYMEQFLRKVIRKMVNLSAKKRSSNLLIRMFEDEIKQLAKVYPDLAERYDEETGKLTLDKKRTGSMLYDYEIVPGSTYMVDQQAQQQNLVMLMRTIIEAPQILELIGQDYEIKFGELFKRIISNSGIQDWDRIVIEKTDEEKADDVIRQDQERFINAVTGGMNQIPPKEAMQANVQAGAQAG